jgi:hypothetical protein
MQSIFFLLGLQYKIFLGLQKIRRLSDSPVTSQKLLVKMSKVVIPAEAGIHKWATILNKWTPAFAGVTVLFCIYKHFLRSYRFFQERPEITKVFLK